MVIQATANKAPVERSIPAVIITNVTPTLIIPTMPAFRKIENIFPRFRKLSLVAENTMKKITSVAREI
jgi:hypothetical protein